MAKGWSFGGLVAALKAAAFRGVGVNTGELIESGGQLGIGSGSISAIKNFNWQTYQFRAGQYLFIEMSSAINTPSIFQWLTSEWMPILVTARGDGEDRVGLLAMPTHNSESNIAEISFIGAAGSRVFDYRTIMATKQDLGTKHLNGFVTRSSVGIYAQPLDANATTSLGYPVAQSGVLTVLPSAYAVMHIYQSTSGRMFQRNIIDGVWSSWVEYVTVGGRQYLDVSSIEITDNTPFIDFHYNKGTTNYDVRLINNSPNVLELATASRGTLKLSNSNILGTLSAQGFSETYDNPSRTMLRGADLKQDSDSWIPFVGARLSKSNKGYMTCISYGAHMRVGHYFSNPMIQAWNDNSTYSNWEFSNQSGDITYTDGKTTRKFLLLDYADSRYALADSIRGCVVGVRHIGISRIQIYQFDTNYLVPEGCVMVGVGSNGGDTIGDWILYSQEQVNIPALGGWVNIGRA